MRAVVYVSSTLAWSRAERGHIALYCLRDQSLPVRAGVADEQAVVVHPSLLYILEITPSSFHAKSVHWV